MSKPFPALCRDCMHSEPDNSSTWNLRCQHPVVNAADPWALSSSDKGGGSDCLRQREQTSFRAKCGMKGKLWEASPTPEAQ